MKKQHQLIIAIIATAVIAFGTGFFTGKLIKPKFDQAMMAGQGQQNNRQGGMGQTQNQGQNQVQPRQGMQPVAGEILSQDEKSITVKLNNGGSKIVLITEKTTINKAAEATKADLVTGETVSVFGTENTDGSVTAQNIQLNPISRGQN